MRTQTSTSLLAALVATVGIPALAQVSLPSAGSPVKPRVFVIFDTSTSMQQDPAYGSNGLLWDTDDTNTDAEVPPTPCRSKFCIAKSVVYDVLKVHTDEVRLGVASYFQYLVRYTGKDLRQTKCWYDAMFKPGFTLYYPRNGTTQTQYEGMTTVGQQTAADIDLAGLSDSHHTSCTAANNTKYRLTVSIANLASTQSCSIYSYNTYPASFTAPSGMASSCVSGKTYTTVAAPAAPSQSIDPSTCPGGGTCYVRRYAAGSSCPAFVDSSTVAAASPSLTVSPGSNDAVCGSVPCWESYANVATDCPAGAPCKMFSSSSTGVDVVTKQSWYGVFEGNCFGGPNAGTGTPFNCSNPAATWPATATPFKHVSRVDSAVSTPFNSIITGQTACVGTLGVKTRYTDSGNRTRFITAATYTTQTGLLPLPGGYSNATPVSKCTPEWPCDTTLTLDTPVPQLPTISTVQNCPVPLSGGQTCVPAANAATVYKLYKNGASCPDLTTGSPYTAAPSSTLWNAAPACATGTGACNFVPASTATSAGTASCSASVTRWDSTAQGTCTWMGTNFNYAAGAVTPYTVTKTITQASTCPVTGSDAKNATVYGTATDWSGNTTQLNNCRAGSTTCDLTYVNQAPSASMELSAWVSSTTPPSGYSNPQTSETNVGGYVDIAADCSVYTNGTSYMVAGVLGQFISGPGPGGATVVGVSGENNIYKCRFQQRQRQWSRAKVSCNYTVSSRVYTTNNNITWCQYQLKNWTLSTPNPSLHDCTYSSVVRRFDFQYPTAKQCSFYRVKTTGTRPIYDFQYSYQTKGGELAGSAYTLTAGDQTNAATAYSTFSSDCPATWDACLGTGTMCYLRNNTGGGITFSKHINATNNGRTQGYSSSFSFELSAASNFPERSGANAGKNTTAVGYSCRASDYTTPPATEPARASYTVMQGTAPNPNPTYRLVSDWFECTDPNDINTCATNDIAALNSDTRTGTSSLNPNTMAAQARDSIAGPFNTLTTADWTNQTRKGYGYSGVGSTYSTPSQMFLSFPADNDVGGNLGGLKTLMSKCAPPTYSNVSGLSWSSQGLCMPDIGSPNSLASPMLDYTPLYGSLRNAKEYIRESLASDTTFAGNNTTCRPYFVILATDGAENTPSNYASERPAVIPPNPNPTQLQAAVASLRTVTDGSRNVDAKTYVIGFGDAIADPGNAAALNAMASTGGTTAAYFASDRASLITELNNVFSSILQGTYSRSKPVISTDGNSIYASQFDRNAATPEWKGRLYAYGINSSDGSLTQRWELSDKLNATTFTDSSRNLYTDVWSATPVKQSFVDSNATVTTRLDDSPSYPVGLATDRLVRFVRNATLAETFNQATAPPKRESRLNAIVHSAPVVVGKSVAPAWWGGVPGSTSYGSFATFQANTATRENRVIVGASDGLLRGVRDNTSNPTDDGNESWGWVPSSIHQYLYKTMSGYYPGIDGQLAIADVCAVDNANGDADSCATANWKTVAVAAMRGGSRGMVALDVTDPNDPKPQWRYVPASDGTGTAYSFSAPVIGRVELASKDVFLAVFGGGSRENGVEGPLSQDHGDEVYFLNAVSGDTVKFFNAEGDMELDDIWGQDNQFFARPSFWERAGSPYMDHAMFSGVNGNLYISRFRKPVQISGGAVVVPPITDTDKWRPEIFFDPTSTVNRDSPNGTAVSVRRVKEDQSTTPWTYSLVTSDGSWSGETLPLTRSLPVYVRPRSAPVYDSTRLVPDYFYGTGDGFQPGDPRTEFEWNYFYAIHDGNKHDDGKHDGQPLWVNQFISRREQVVSEPAMVNGALIVATYLPAQTLSPCENAGDTTLYCFNPKNGELVNCLVDSSTPSGTTSVRHYAGVGIPSDLVTVGENLYWTASNLTGQPQHEQVRPSTEQGDVRSWRRTR